MMRLVKLASSKWSQDMDLNSWLMMIKRDEAIYDKWSGCGAGRLYVLGCEKGVTKFMFNNCNYHIWSRIVNWYCNYSRPGTWVNIWMINLNFYEKNFSIFAFSRNSMVLERSFMCNWFLIFQNSKSLDRGRKETSQLITIVPLIPQGDIDLVFSWFSLGFIGFLG